MALLPVPGLGRPDLSRLPVGHAAARGNALRRRARAPGLAVSKSAGSAAGCRIAAAEVHGLRPLRLPGRSGSRGRPARPVALPPSGGQADVPLRRGQAAQPRLDMVATDRTRRALPDPAAAGHGKLVRPPPPGLVPPPFGRDHVRGRAGRALVPVLAPPATARSGSAAGTPVVDRGDRQLRLLQPADRRALPVLAPRQPRARPIPSASPAVPEHGSAGLPPRRSCCSASRSRPAN